jgi:hypothetical protein
MQRRLPFTFRDDDVNPWGAAHKHGTDLWIVTAERISQYDG